MKQEMKPFRSKVNDVNYTKYFGLNISNRLSKNKESTSKIYRVFQVHRLNKSKLIRELKDFINILEKEKIDGVSK